MGERNLQQFFLTCDNDYILKNLLKVTRETDFDEINAIAAKRGYPEICIDSDVDIAMVQDKMKDCFGDDWYMDLPQRKTAEYEYLGRIVNAIKSAFKEQP